MVQAARAVMTPEVGAVGVAAAGLVESSTGILRFAPHPARRDAPLVAHLEAELRLPVVADNDNTAAVWGEHRFGAGRGHADVLLVVLGTGIVGGIVAGGKLLRGAHGFAGEIGHIVMDPSGPLCGCGNHGCWEQLASGQAVTRAGRRAVRDRLETSLVELSGGDAERVTGSMVTDAANAGDIVAVSILTGVGRWLGTGIAGLVNVLDPEIVVLAGGVADAGDLLLQPAREGYRAAVEAVDHRPDVPLVLAELGGDTGVVGAASLVL